MKNLLVYALLLVSASAMAGLNGFIWGHTGLAPQAAQLNGSMASVNGLLKANPMGEADMPGLSQVLMTRAADVRANLTTFSAALNVAMDGLTQENRQLALNDYCVFMVEIRDLKTAAEGRFLDEVSLALGETYRQYALAGFSWGNKFGLVVPPMKDVEP